MDARIYLYGEIGWDVDEADVLKQISQAKRDGAEQIIVAISSFGGFVYSGRAIYNALKTSGLPVRVEIVGQAFSIASYIAMAGDEILIAEKGEMMIHPAWTFAEGNAEELRKHADALEEMSEEIFQTYVARGANEDTIRPYFEEETILSAQEAIDAGLATGLLETMKAAAKFRKGDFKTEHKSDKTSIMNTTLTEIHDKVNKLFARFGGTTAKNGVVSAEEGSLYFDGDVIEVGTAVFSDEAMETPAGDGDYNEGDTTYVVAQGVVSEILDNSEGDGEEEAVDVDGLNARIDELEAENEELRASNAEQSTELEEIRAEVKEIRDALATSMTDTKNRKPAKDSTVKTVAQIMKEKAEANRSRFTK